MFRTENVSQFVSELKPFGEIDFLHAFRPLSKKMLKRAKSVKILEGKLRVKILSSEDIIGLKVQAMVNDPSRYEKEMQDIKSLLQAQGKNINWDIIKNYFLLFSREKEYKELKKKYERTK